MGGKHVVFGRVVKGMDVVGQIDAVGTLSGVPAETVTIVDCGLWSDNSTSKKGYPTVASNLQNEGNSEAVKPRIGQTVGSMRTTTLRHMPPAACPGYAGFSGNHPKCPFCGA